MFCDQCGAKINDDSLFCNKCGQKINRVEEEVVSAGQNYTPPKENPAAQQVETHYIETVQPKAKQLDKVEPGIQTGNAAVSVETNHSPLSVNTSSAPASNDSRMATPINTWSNTEENARSSKVVPLSTEASVNKKPQKKKLILIIAAAVLVVLLGIALGVSTCVANKNNPNQADWPTSNLASMIPQYSKKCTFAYEYNNSLNIKISKTVDWKSYQEYLTKCRDKGFTVDQKEGNIDFQSYNSEGYWLHVVFHDYSNIDDEISIYLESPRTNEKLHWPKTGLGTVIPDPQKQKGSIPTDTSDKFVAYVGEVSTEDYNTYIDKLIDAGFTEKVSHKEESFYAENPSGYKIYLEYRGYNNLGIFLDVVKK